MRGEGRGIRDEGRGVREKAKGCDLPPRWGRLKPKISTLILHT